MTEDKPLIFGISPGPFGDNPYAFIDVLGVVTKGRIHVVDDPIAQFPDRGNVYLSKDYWIPPEGHAAIWRVAQGLSDEHTAKFQVIARGRRGPLEILTAPFDSREPERIRHYLLEGIRLRYPPANDVLVHLEDGLVIGPLHAEAGRDPTLRAFYCSEESFRDPFGCWALEELHPIELIHGGERRRYSSLLELPAPERHYDLADLDTRLEIVVSFLAREGALSDFTRPHIELLAEVLRSSNAPQRVALRVDEFLAAASQAALDAGQVRRLIEALKGTKQVRDALAHEAEEARKSGLEALRLQEVELFVRIEELRKQHSDLEKEIAESRSRIERAAEHTLETIAQRVRAAQADAGDLLAQVALLRPFLRDSTKATHSAMEPASLRPPELVRQGTSLTELQAALDANLRMVGLKSGSAEALSCEVIASLLAGQLAMFSGSLAPLVARIAARTLAPNDAYYLRVPVGLIESSGLDQVLARLTARCAESDTVCAIVFEGMNRSAVEAYADQLRERVLESAFSLTSRREALLCLGTIITGPSTLPAATHLTDLGPIFDTDCLLTGTPKDDDSQVGVSVSVQNWLDWSNAAAAASPPDTEEFQLILEAGAGLGAAWQRNLNRALHALCAVLPEQSPQSPVASLCYGWVTPRFLSNGQGTGVTVRAIVEELEESGALDPRLKRVLSRLPDTENLT